MSPDITPHLDSYRLEIPNWHPTRLNTLLHCHWGRRSRLKRQDRHILSLALASAQVEPANTRRIKRRIDLTIILGKRQRAGDPDAYWKCLLDCLVKLGALVDDSRHWVELAPVQFERSIQPATVITLTDLEVRTT